MSIGTTKAKGGQTNLSTRPSWATRFIREKRKIISGGRFPVVSGGRQEVVQVGNAGNSKYWWNTMRCIMVARLGFCNNELNQAWWLVLSRRVLFVKASLKLACRKCYSCKTLLRGFRKATQQSLHNMPSSKKPHMINISVSTRNEIANKEP